MRDALAARGLACEVHELAASTRTAQEAAAAVGCSVGQIVKSLVFRTARSDRLVLALASGTNRVSEAKLEARLGEPVKRADAAFVRERTGFAIGGVPPLGHAAPGVVLVDRDLLAFDVVWTAAGTPHAVFQVAPPDLVRAAGGEVVDLAEPAVPAP
ncbi:MAG TPA: YbaK/EbsC family protein [Anaeromyxobacteraceae bacterium]|nr:YbaK/EbsC family protein [Anaeromyxobacteraceae bacterium]